MSSETLDPNADMSGYSYSISDDVYVNPVIDVEKLQLPDVAPLYAIVDGMSIIHCCGISSVNTGQPKQSGKGSWQ